MGVEYYKPTWVNNDEPAISAGRLQSISDVLDAIVNGAETKPITKIETNDKEVVITYLDGSIRSIYNPVAGPKGDRGEPGPFPMGLVLQKQVGRIRTYVLKYSNGVNYAFDVLDGPEGPGTGDMLQSIYDKDKDGIVDLSSAVWTGKRKISGIEIQERMFGNNLFRNIVSFTADPSENEYNTIETRVYLEAGQYCLSWDQSEELTSNTRNTPIIHFSPSPSTIKRLIQYDEPNKNLEKGRHLWEFYADVSGYYGFEFWTDGINKTVKYDKFQLEMGEFSTPYQPPMKSNSELTEAIEQVTERLSESEDWLRSKNLYPLGDNLIYGSNNAYYGSEPFYLPIGDYIFSTKNKYSKDIVVWFTDDSPVTDKDIHTITVNETVEITFSVTSESTPIVLGGRASDRSTLTTPNVLAEIMVREATETDASYQPYSDSNVELTAKLSDAEESGFIGKNKLPYKNYSDNSIFKPHYTDGMLDYILVNGTISSTLDFVLLQDAKCLKENESYVALATGDSNISLQIYNYTDASTNTKLAEVTLSNVEFTVPSTSIKMLIGYRASSGTYNNVKLYPMICKKGMDESYQPSFKSPSQLTEEIATIGKIHYLDHTYKFSVDSKGLVILNYPSSLIGKHVFSIFTTKSDGDPCSNIALYEPDVQSSSKFVCYGEANKSYNSYTFRFAYFD